MTETMLCISVYCMQTKDLSITHINEPNDLIIRVYDILS